ncbi:GntR family transcriptional regulator [Methylobacterium currus]|uniref:GntR family transcriptional regulator n=2 Tax=Methylobacterium currus TaxID=2051553 RepID=A0A2R4WWG0_9HYPH|nr:GntR family transcriptional regulator [Methylobacterium currus]
MSGMILPGNAVTSRSLSKAMGVSSTPVREALKQLEAEGVLASRNKSAFFVTAPTRGEFREILDIRLLLEGFAIRRAAQVATDENLAAFRALNAQYEAVLRDPTANRGRSLAPNFRFHFEIYRLAGSPLLMTTIEGLWLRIGPMLHEFVSHIPDHGDTAIEHRQMLDALARNDPDAAESALRADLIGAFEEIAKVLKD